MSSQSRRQAFAKLLAVVKPLGKSFLKQQVEKVKLAEAASMNRAGVTCQLLYLLRQLGLKRVSRLVNSLLAEEDRLRRLEREASRRGLVSRLTAAAYERKLAEAASLVAGKVSRLITYLEQQGVSVAEKLRSPESWSGHGRVI